MLTIKRYFVTVEDGIYRTKYEYIDTSVLGVRLKRNIKEVWRKSALIPDELRAMVFESDRHTCVYCGATGVSLAVDHVFPQVYHGLTEYDNLVSACKKCNSAKNGRTPEEAGMAFVAGRYRHGDISAHKAHTKAYRPCRSSGGIEVATSHKVYRLPEYEYRWAQAVEYVPSPGSLLSWGYTGAGPKYTAYAILRDLLGHRCASNHLRRFAREVIRELPRDEAWELQGEEIVRWLDESAPKTEHKDEHDPLTKLITTRIARGETKTDVVKSMPGYASRRHADFAAMYDRLRAAYDEAESVVVEQ